MTGRPAELARRLVGGGIRVVGQHGLELDPAAAAWAAYIPISARTGKLLPGGDGLAIAMATGAVIDGGCGGEADDLYARAAGAERRFFGAREAIQAPEAFPSRLALFGRSRVTVAAASVPAE